MSLYVVSHVTSGPLIGFIVWGVRLVRSLDELERLLQLEVRGSAAVSVNNRLRALRAERGWSQSEVAGRLEVSRQTIHAIESGKYDPSLPLAFAIARLFGQLIEEIFSPEAAPPVADGVAPDERSRGERRV